MFTYNLINRNIWNCITRGALIPTHTKQYISTTRWAVSTLCDAKLCNKTHKIRIMRKTWLHKLQWSSTHFIKYWNTVAHYLLTFFTVGLAWLSIAVFSFLDDVLYFRRHWTWMFSVAERISKNVIRGHRSDTFLLLFNSNHERSSYLFQYSQILVENRQFFMTNNVYLSPPVGWPR